MDFDYFYRHKHQIKILELHVSNLLAWVDENYLAEFFSRWASIKYVAILKLHHKDTLSALVGFWDFKQMMTALKNSHRSILGGQKIFVDFSKQAVICCNFCFKFGHLMDSCQQIKSRPQFNRSNQRVNDRGQQSREKPDSFTRHYDSKYERKTNKRKSPFQRHYKKWSPKPQGQNKKKMSFYSLHKKQNSKISQSNYHPTFYEQCSMAQTTYDSEREDRKFRNRKLQNKNKSEESEEELQFVKIIGPKEHSQGWISLEDELKLERLEKQGFFSGTCKLKNKFVRIVRPKAKGNQEDF